MKFATAPEVRIHRTVRLNQEGLYCPRIVRTLFDPVEELGKGVDLIIVFPVPLHGEERRAAYERAATQLNVEAQVRDALGAYDAARETLELFGIPPCGEVSMRRPSGPARRPLLRASFA